MHSKLKCSVMDADSDITPDSSTAKRRRLGTGQIIRSQYSFMQDESARLNENCSPIRSMNLTSTVTSSDGRESPHLPCNQIEYLCDSTNDSTDDEDEEEGDESSSSSSSDVENTENQQWESMVVNADNLQQINAAEIESKSESETENEDLEDDVFLSQLEQSKHKEAMKAKTDERFKQIDKSFDVINASICQLHNEIVENNNNSDLFESKDSFLLNVRESVEEQKKEEKEDLKSPTKATEEYNYYGLPMITKGLFKTYRNIDKFYEWQRECLNLPAIKERRNLIYALPTSGGKTLVAEVLMLREVLNRRKNALFILPFVAIVQEKIWCLSPFAVELGFLVEEYAGGKGHLPPKKRRNKNSIYIATIEKGLALIRNLIELERLEEIGLIVVDELHLIGERGRGGTLETLLSTVIFASSNIQIVGMSATIGNLPEMATFMKAEVFQRHFRPVELAEYVKLGNVLHKIVWGEEGMELVPDRELAFNYSSAGTSLDPDWLGGLVAEVVPWASCLVFCPTKRNCENVAQLLCKLQRRDMVTHRTSDREILETALRGEGATGDLCRATRCGVAYHHAGLSGDERAMLEHAFRSGVISVLCCTSTLAAGVNLPAQRVIVRAPYVGREFLSLGAYRQMSGRAGRAGVCDTGESIIICSERDWVPLKTVLSGGIAPARSMLAGGGVAGLMLSAVGLRLARRPPQLRALLAHTLLAVPHAECPQVDTNAMCDDALKAMLKSGALEVKKEPNPLIRLNDDIMYTDSSELTVSQLGRAAMKGCMDLTTAKQLQQDLEVASRAMVLMGSLHLLYLVTPHDAAGVKPDYRHYYSLFCSLNEEGIQTANVLGITEMNAIRMMTGKPITSVPERVLSRFYIALMLHDLWKQEPFPAVADKYGITRGLLQSVMTSSAAFASSAHRFCEELEHLWPFRALFCDLSLRLQHCAAPELHHLMELPAVKKARALQLMRAGFRRVEEVARADIDHLVANVPHMSRSAATHLTSAARMMLIEKVENLRAEAENVMDELNE